MATVREKTQDRVGADSRQQVAPGQETLRRGPWLAVVGGGVLALGLMRSARMGDGQVLIWATASLTGMIGAVVVGTMRGRNGRAVGLRDYWQGAYGFTGVLGLAGYALWGANAAAALLGTGLVTALFGGVAIAGFRGRIAGRYRGNVEAPRAAAGPATLAGGQPTPIRLRSERERGRWLMDQHVGEFVDVLYLPDASFAGTLDYDPQVDPLGPFRAEVVTHEGRVVSVQVEVAPRVDGWYITDLRSADGESGLIYPDRVRIADALGINTPGYFRVAETQFPDQASS